MVKRLARATRATCARRAGRATVAVEREQRDDTGSSSLSHINYTGGRKWDGCLLTLKASGPYSPLSAEALIASISRAMSVSRTR
jgi:hypothetical protein